MTFITGNKQKFCVYTLVSSAIYWTFRLLHGQVSVLKKDYSYSIHTNTGSQVQQRTLSEHLSVFIS